MDGFFCWLLTDGDTQGKGSLVLEKTMNIEYFGSEVSREFIDLIHNCLSDKGSARPSALLLKKVMCELIVALERVTSNMEGQATVIIEEDTITGSKIDIQNLRRIGRFVIEEKIGKGGMGVVYKARDTTDDSIVALKTISPQRAEDTDCLQRFYKEARLLAEVNNPYVSNMLEINQEQSIHYLVMEYIAGDNLSDTLKARKVLKEKEALLIIANVIRALITAHERQIVHRDIKPANIILVNDEVFEMIENSFYNEYCKQNVCKVI